MIRRVGINPDCCVRGSAAAVVFCSPSGFLGAKCYLNVIRSAPDIKIIAFAKCYRDALKT